MAVLRAAAIESGGAIGVGVETCLVITEANDGCAVLLGYGYRYSADDFSEHRNWMGQLQSDLVSCVSLP